MFPAPTTIPTSTPRSRTSLTWRATAATRAGSVPNGSSPISASPESFRRMRLKAGAIWAESLLADGKAHETADHDVLTRLRGELVAQLLDGLALELGVVQLLLEQHDRLVPGVELALDDLPTYVLRLVRGLLLVDACLCVARLGRHVLTGDVGDGGAGGD